MAPHHARRRVVIATRSGAVSLGVQRMSRLLWGSPASLLSVAAEQGGMQGRGVPIPDAIHACMSARIHDAVFGNIAPFMLPVPCRGLLLGSRRGVESSGKPEPASAACWCVCGWRLHCRRNTSLLHAASRVVPCIQPCYSKLHAVPALIYMRLHFCVTLLQAFCFC